MIRIFPLTVIAAALFAAAPTQAETAQDIIEHHANAVISDLETYLEAHPEAPDRLEAVDAMIQSAFAVGDKAKMVDLFERKYTIARETDALGPRELAGYILRPHAQFALELGEKERAKAFVDRVREDYKDAGPNSPVLQTLAQIQGMFAQPSVGDRMEVSGTAVDGRSVDLAALEGKVVLVDFWATWCGPCVQELPNVKEMYAKYHDKGFEVIGISRDRDENALTNFIAKRDIPWPNILDTTRGQDQLAARYGINAIPAMFLIGKDGKIVATNVRGDRLEAELEKRLGAM